MSFQPRIRSASETNPGAICCSSPVAKHRCPKCQPAAVENNLRSAEDFSPPDPYAAGIAAQRLSDAKAAAAKTYQPAPRPTEMHLNAHGVPDPYFHAIEAIRKEGR